MLVVVEAAVVVVWSRKWRWWWWWRLMRALPSLSFEYGPLTVWWRERRFLQLLHLLLRLSVSPAAPFQVSPIGGIDSVIRLDRLSSIEA